MQPAGRSLMAFRVALATLLLANVAYTSKKQKRQLFHENLLPYFGGKIPESAFQADRLALNMLNKEGISVPDGILFEARPKESFHQSPRNDPELSNSILKMIHTPDTRFIPSEGKYDGNNEVETTYKISIPTYMQNYQLPKFRPITETLQLPVRQIFESGLSITNFRGQLGVPFNTIPKGWKSFDARRPSSLNIPNKIMDFRQNENILPMTSFVCGRPGRIYPDPETQCQAFHLCHYNGYKETFVCPQGTRYDPSVQECRFWYTTHCLDTRRPFN
ncbi:uncharacterized protein LOC132932059 [Rhopalosiphum padi]|uniref:uncharacterized protein LOC132932059 n=1 Tax=Rhopalosiphum padi TaxID=40932 RepID=UPI00298EB48B|nr:uncharacterized protein LOC132932059 [Rhopalosiphum padi]XP_060854235.1 uncharacterized protein LOC132932059 [Rhopalosiphum padi]